MRRNRYLVAKTLTFRTRVNSKATLRVPLDKLRGIVPGIIYHQLSASSYYARNTNSLLIQWDSSRKQNDNIEGCWTRLYSLFQDAAKNVVRGETSAQQANKVKELSVSPFTWPLIY